MISILGLAFFILSSKLSDGSGFCVHPYSHKLIFNNLHGSANWVLVQCSKGGSWIICNCAILRSASPSQLRFSLVFLPRLFFFIVIFIQHTLSPRRQRHNTGWGSVHSAFFQTVGFQGFSCPGVVHMSLYGCDAFRLHVSQYFPSNINKTNSLHQCQNFLREILLNNNNFLIEVHCWPSFQMNTGTVAALN